MRNKWLKDRLNEIGKTQAGLAETLGLAPSAGTKLITGERRIDGKEVAAVARYLEWPTEVLTSILEDPAAPSVVHYGFLRVYLRQPGANHRQIAQRIGATADEIEDFLAGKRSAAGDPARVKLYVESRFDREVPEDLRGDVPDQDQPNARVSSLLPPARLEMLRDIPVYGTAACGDEGAFHLNTGEPIDWVRRPTGIAHTKNVYAIYAEGDSMMPAFRPGALVYVDPNRKASIGHDIVIQVPPKRDGDGPTCYLKRLVKRTAADLVVEQFNPQKTLKFPAESLAHRVLTLEELLGV